VKAALQDGTSQRGQGHYAKTAPLLADIHSVLEEYQAYLPLTIRQVFYRLVGRGYTKSEDFYNQVKEVCNRGRRSRRISFHAIRDDGISHQGGDDYGYDSPEDYYETIETISNYYSRSWHADQPAFVQVLCEAAGMVPMLESAIEDLRVGVASSSGFDSLTAKHDLFREAMLRYQAVRQRTILLHVGDHDPSGYWMHRSMAEDFDAFCCDREVEGIMELRRTLLTPSQIQDWGIAPDTKQPSADAKHSHSKQFAELGLLPAAQVEAVPPDVLTQKVRQGVKEALDLEILEASAERERCEYDVVQEKIDEANEALRSVFDLSEAG
jgi:hypothetical protein